MNLWSWFQNHVGSVNLYASAVTLYVMCNKFVVFTENQGFTITQPFSDRHSSCLSSLNLHLRYSVLNAAMADT